MTATARVVRSELTATGAALAAGRIGYAQAAAVTHAVQALPADVTVPPVDDAGEPDPGGVPGPVRAVGEAHLLDLAARHDAGQLDRLGRHLRAVIAPGDRAGRRSRGVAPAGGVRPGTPGAVLVARPQRWDVPVRAPRPRRRAGREGSDRGAVRAGGEPTQVVVQLPLDTLIRGLGTAACQDGQLISPGLARKLACGAKIIPAVLGADSAVLDLGGAQRLFTGARRRAVTLRDRGCAFPVATGRRRGATSIM